MTIKSQRIPLSLSLSLSLSPLSLSKKKERKRRSGGEKSLEERLTRYNGRRIAKTINEKKIAEEKLIGEARKCKWKLVSNKGSCTHGRL